MTSHHVNVIRNKKRLAPVRVFSCKHLLRLRKTSPFAVKSIPSFTNFKKSFKTFRFYQSSLRLIYLNPLTPFSRSYALIIKERARALRSLHCLRNTYRCKNIWLWHQRTFAWPYRLGIGWRRIFKEGKGSPRHATCVCLGIKLTSLEATNIFTPVKSQIGVSCSDLKQKLSRILLN